MLSIISHDLCLGHDTGRLHPEAPIRLNAIWNQLLMSGLDQVLTRYDAPEATVEQLERVHTPDHVRSLIEMADQGTIAQLDPDTPFSPGTLPAALRAAGAGVMGVDMIMSGKGNPIFCIVRPPGHHAERARAMGFCFFNNIAVAAAHAMEVHGLSRVAIVDFDVHHGNGTEDIFANDDRVLFCSSFRHPFYPFTGHGSDTRNLVDVPLPAGTRGPAFRAAVTEHWLPALDKFRPEMVLVSAGFDAHVLDDMGGLALVEDDYAWITRELMGVAARHSQGRLLSMLEGGYEPGALGRSVVAHLNAMF